MKLIILCLLLGGCANMRILYHDDHDTVRIKGKGILYERRF